jgi:exodeoxyribonuclease-1
MDVKKTFLFYDIETTGLNKCFDQIIQFAAIRTDEALNEIERHEINIKLNPDVIPAPMAMITHRLSLEQLNHGVSEFEAIRLIHQQLNIPGTISLGYNTLGFDDEFLRFSFYRNLLPPYTHQYANFCSRADLYPMTVMYYLFHQQGLNWPTTEDKISLKLEHLNAYNQLAPGQSHHALCDVEATIALARIFYRNTEMWEYLLANFDKQKDLQRQQLLEKNNFLGRSLALLVDGKMGADARFQSPVLSLGSHQQYKNQSLWLRLDREDLSQSTEEDFSTTTWVITKKIGETGFLLPYIPRYKNHLSEQRQELVSKNLTWLAQSPKILENICHHYQNYTYPKWPAIDSHATLYDQGFWSREEEMQCRSFHQATPGKKENVIEQMQSSHLKQLALRIMGRHFPEYLSSKLCQEFDDYLKSLNPQEEKNIAIDFRGEKRLTAQTALQEINVLNNSEKLDALQKNLLAELESYIKTRFVDQY